MPGTLPGYPAQGFLAPSPQPNLFTFQPQQGPNNHVGSHAPRRNRLERNMRLKKEAEEDSKDPNLSLEKKANTSSGKKAESEAFDTRVERGTWTFDDFTKTFPGQKYPEQRWASTEVCQVIVDAWTTSDASVGERTPRAPFQWKGKPESLLSETAYRKWLRGRASFYRGLLEQPALVTARVSFRHNPVNEADANKHLAERTLERLELGQYEYPKDILSLWRTFQTSFEVYSKGRADKKVNPQASPSNSYRLAAMESAKAWEQEASSWMISQQKSEAEQKKLKNYLQGAWGRLVSSTLLLYYERVAAIQVDAVRALTSTLTESGCYDKSGGLLEGRKHDPWVISVLKEDTQGALLALHTVTAIFHKTAGWWKADLEKRIRPLVEIEGDPDVAPFGAILEGWFQTYAEITQPMPEFGVMLQVPFVMPAAIAEGSEDEDEDGADGDG
jgi:hypothetical protein